MRALVFPVGRLGLFPPLQQPLVEPVDFHPERTADLQGIAGVRSPQGHGQVAAGAGGQGAEQVDLGEELQVVAGLSRMKYWSCWFRPVHWKTLSTSCTSVSVNPWGATARVRLEWQQKSKSSPVSILFT